MIESKLEYFYLHPMNKKALESCLLAYSKSINQLWILASIITQNYEDSIDNRLIGPNPSKHEAVTSQAIITHAHTHTYTDKHTQEFKFIILDHFLLEGKLPRMSLNLDIHAVGRLSLTNTAAWLQHAMKVV